MILITLFFTLHLGFNSYRYYAMPFFLKSLLITFLLLFSLSILANPDIDLIRLEHKPPAPEFSLPGMDDKVHKLSDYRGKPVIVSFWATWCPPCRAELPSMNRAWDKIKGDDIIMLFVNINEGKEDIEAFEEVYPINFTVLRDETAGQLHNWNMTGLPTTFIIDPVGRVVYQAMGEREWDNDDILNKIRALRTVEKNKIIDKKQASLNQ